ncbi:hypothetical protein [Luteolibacter luteus]|uniref:Lipoprotein n=1 Tax=Luteolibacter luteus TaxID=2728835 RepID=A0A858RE40_9BACT|nr:hypothetical protein [Luteolibacter luteus]QJE95077.1 hypothetical protein HHL09_04575 [Luteolibacter luteus]
MKFPVRLLPLLPALSLMACSGTGGDSNAMVAKESASPDPVENKRIKTGDPLTGDHDGAKMEAKWGSFSKYSVDKNGKPRGSSKEFAGFNRDNPEFKGKWEGKEYKAGDYRKKSFWGDKDYAKKVYEGNTDGNSFKKDSRFGGKSANEGALAAREGGKNYRTNTYASGAAREQSQKDITKLSDSETDERRRVFTAPDIFSSRSGMSVNDTNRMLGR